MDAIDLLLTRRSVKAFDLVEPGPGAADMRRILEAGIRVPDHGKLGPWRLQVLDKDAQARLGDVAAERFRALHPDARDKQIAFERQRLQRAPVLVVVTSVREKSGGKIPEIEQLLSAGALCQNMLVAAHALGYAAQWLTEWPAYDAAIKRALGRGEGDDIVGFVYIGSAAKAPEERDRPRVEDRLDPWPA